MERSEVWVEFVKVMIPATRDVEEAVRVADALLERYDKMFSKKVRVGFGAVENGNA